MNQYTVVNPLGGENIVVRAQAQDEAALMALCRHGVVIRPATAAEIQEVEGIEVEMEYDEPDIGYFFPEEEGCLILHIKDW